MSRSTICRVSLLWLAAALCVLAVAVETADAEAPCSASPQAAAASYLGETPQDTHPGTAAGRMTANTGFRVQRVLDDAAQNRTWLWIQSCEFPARPAQLTWVPGEHPFHPVRGGARRVDVHAGDEVLVMKSSGVALVQITGRALRDGYRGQSVPVRLPGFQGNMVVSGRITEPGVVRLGESGAN